jgi:uncharacterized RDD family membrane protein YckC
MSSNTMEQLGSRQFCSECGRPFAAEDLVRFGAAAVCGDCKPKYVQRMREGAVTTNTFLYGGFWRRFVAVMIDGILLWIVLFPLRWVILTMGASAGLGNSQVKPIDVFWMSFWSWATLLSWSVEIIYSVYFTSQKGATLGKMLMGVKVVTANGGPVSVGRALGRFFAHYLSGLILSIGYIMAAFDDQKRALHDHICNTRVIRD